VEVNIQQEQQDEPKSKIQQFLEKHSVSFDEIKQQVFDQLAEKEHIRFELRIDGTERER